MKKTQVWKSMARPLRGGSKIEIRNPKQTQISKCRQNEEKKTFQSLEFFYHNFPSIENHVAALYERPGKGWSAQSLARFGRAATPSRPLGVRRLVCALMGATSRADGKRRHSAAVQITSAG
jgi:hypothetical protein